MNPENRSPHPGQHRRRGFRTFSGQVAHRVKHRVAFKIMMALIKLAAVATLALLIMVVLVLFYVAWIL